MRVALINGSYRRAGAVSQALAEAASAARAAGAEVTEFFLMDKHVEFCTNCRACTQKPGDKRGECVLKDDMGAMLDAVDAADGLILGAPMNFYNITAVARRFLERLVGYAYWPWSQGAPTMRVKDRKKKAVLISASAAPALFARVFTPGAMKALKMFAETLGAKPVGKMSIGLSGMTEKYVLTASERAKARRLGELVARG
ncbi:MAG: flavodoxin family protein [Elusimicrobiota bacterium]|jgi:multimeric flavodoxin WrbA